MEKKARRKNNAHVFRERRNKDIFYRIFAERKYHILP